MILNDDYIEFDLKALFFYILRHWKVLLIFGLLFASLMGGLQAFSEYKTGLAVDLESNYWLEHQQHQEQTAFYENRVQTTQEKIDSLQEYIDHSVLMNADYRNIYIAKAVYYVDSGYQILPEHTYQNPDKTYSLTWYYCNYLTDYSVFSEIGIEIGVDAKYLMELVTISVSDGNALAVSVSHPTQHTAERILEILQTKLKQAHIHLCETIQEHSITLMINTCGVYIDEELHEAQQKVHDELLELQDDLLTYKQELYNLKSSSVPGELNVATAFIKWFFLGGVVGVILTAVFLFIKSILRNRLHSPAQLAANFHTIVLGEVICSCKDLPWIERHLNRIEGCLSKNSEENLQFLAENIRSHCKNNHDILICNDIDPTFSVTMINALGKYLSEFRLLPAGSLLKEATALHNLAECDAVVIVVARDRSSNVAVRGILNQIHSCQKDVIGFIMTY